MSSKHVQSIKPARVYGSLEIQLIYGCETRVRYLDKISFIHKEL